MANEKRDALDALTLSNAAMFEQIRAVELRQLEYQRSTDERFERVFDYMEAREAPRQKVFFDGQVFDALLGAHAELPEGWPHQLHSHLHGAVLVRALITGANGSH